MNVHSLHSLQIVFSASDSGSPSASASNSATARITFVRNDFAPVYPQRLYTVNIDETTLTGSVVFNLNASDQDVNVSWYSWFLKSFEYNFYLMTPNRYFDGSYQKSIYLNKIVIKAELMWRTWFMFCWSSAIVIS